MSPRDHDLRVGALVPFKRFTRAKRRLRTEFSDAQVEEIGRAMLTDVLTALHGARSIARATVLTDDDEVAEVARAAGAEVRLEDPDPGLNEVITAAEAELERAGFAASLVVLGDLPLLRAEHVDAVVDRARSAAVVLVPADDGGTALLLRRPPGAVAARFGARSAEAHTRLAREAALPFCRYDALERIVRVDLDTPHDARRLLESGHDCRTSDVLRKLVT